MPDEYVPVEEFLNMLAAEALSALENLNGAMRSMGVQRAERRQVMRGIINAATAKD